LSRARPKRFSLKEHLETLIHQSVNRGIGYEEVLAEFEKRFIRKILGAYSGNQLRAARALGMHRNTLSRKLELYRLDSREFRRRARRATRRRRR
jgi:two-component system nitrogen regulation response regulator GlnG